MLQAEVLLIAVNHNETRAVLEVFLPGRQPPREEIDGRVYYDLGEVNRRQVALTRSEPGADGAQEAVTKGIAALSPKMVINLGVAGGMHREKQQIGEVLVAAQLRPYELSWLGEEEERLRSSKPDASGNLLHLFKNAALHWKAAEVRFGCLLSGDKLVRNGTFRKRLLEFEPEAIGLEMEGKGVYLACKEKPIEWILVKAISDWADRDKNDDVQPVAARNAAAFVDYALRFAPASAPAHEGAHARSLSRKVMLPSAILLLLGMVIGVMIYQLRIAEEYAARLRTADDLGKKPIERPQVLLMGGSGTMISALLPALQSSQEEACRNVARRAFTNDVGSMQALESFSVINIPSIAFMAHRFAPKDAKNPKLRHIAAVEVYLGRGQVKALVNQQNKLSSLKLDKVRSMLTQSGFKWSAFRDDAGTAPQWKSKDQDPAVRLLLPVNCSTNSGTCRSIADALWPDQEAPHFPPQNLPPESGRATWRIHEIYDEVAGDTNALGFISEYVDDPKPGATKHVQIKDQDRNIDILQYFWAYLPLEQRGQNGPMVITGLAKDFTACLLGKAAQEAFADKRKMLDKEAFATQRRWLRVDQGREEYEIDDKVYERAAVGSNIMMIKSDMIKYVGLETAEATSGHK